MKIYYIWAIIAASAVMSPWLNDRTNIGWLIAGILTGIGVFLYFHIKARKNSK